MSRLQTVRTNLFRLLLLPALILAACAASEPQDDPRDVLSSVFAEARAEVSAFGGLGFDAATASGGAAFVAYTLGEDPGSAADLRARPVRGHGSESLAGSGRRCDEPILADALRRRDWEHPRTASNASATSASGLSLMT